ncbi:isoaspartyl peptidase/L-asparaginase family protein [Thalassoglobus polymorphus]|nr:isoaspartyl peptidase/L-asparaginase [Thalassoglobus polymorphus]
MMFSFCLLSFATSTVHAQEVKTTDKFALVIHGGAGGISSKQEWIENREKILTQALDQGTAMLKRGESSLDVVETVVRILEDSPYFNAGKGAVFNAVEKHELDASIMDGRDRSGGAVGGVRTVRNPISLARRVMTETPHVLLATDGAEKFADQFKDDPKIQRVSNDYFSTDHQRERLHKTQKQAKQKETDKMGTVGCVALDRHGNIAAATSTGGLNNKQYGRIGDSPIISAGTFADNETCGVSCTGIGEDYIRNAVAYDVSARMAYRGDSLKKAVQDILNGKKHQVRGGIIAIDKDGNIVTEFNTRGMSRAAADSSGRREVHIGK